MRTGFLRIGIDEKGQMRTETGGELGMAEMILGLELAKMHLLGRTAMSAPVLVPGMLKADLSR